MSNQELIFRVLFSIVASGFIGYDREVKNRPAGFRTHILVCLGATLIALLQTEINNSILAEIAANPQLVNVLRIDRTRLIAQVVSGIGFLGAGTIIVNKKNIVGLTTAASLWSVACLGLCIGMGYYKISLVGTVSAIIVLKFIRKLIKFSTYKSLEIRYVHKDETKRQLTEYFEKNNLSVIDVTFEVDIVDELRIYRNIYTIYSELPHSYVDVLEELSLLPNIKSIRLVNPL